MQYISFHPQPLKSVSRKQVQVVLQKEIYTASESPRSILTADCRELFADEYDLSFVTVGLVDAHGHLVPLTGSLVRLTIGGEAVIGMVLNGNPMSHESPKGSSIKAFSGKCRGE